MKLFSYFDFKKFFIRILLPALLVFIVDRATKNAAIFTALQTGKPLVTNPGLVFGMFSDVLPFARIVFVLTSFGFFFFLFVLLIAFFYETLPWLSVWLSIFLTSIAANAYDRLKYGAVIDFLHLPIQHWSNAYFNYADIFQWCAMFGILHALWRHHDHIWPSENTRNRILIDFGFQIGLALKMVFVCFTVSATVGIFSVSFLFTTLQNTHFIDPVRLKSFMTAYVICFVAILFLFLLITFIFGVYISHRSVGPVFAFRRFLEDYLKGSAKRFRLRKHDHFKSFETLSDKLIERQQKSEKNT